MRRLALLALFAAIIPMAGCRTVGGPVTQTVGGSIWAAGGDDFSLTRPFRKAMIGVAVLPWTLKADRAINRAESRR